jgi:raffinose/stachyose/melibiose transport system substrate-binding protein
MSKYFRLPAAALAAAAVLTFAGCSGDDSGDPASLRVLNYCDTADPASAEEAARVWDAFGEANPHVTLAREDLYGEAYYERVANCRREGNLPDVIFVWPGERSAPLYAGGFLRDLSALAVKDKLEDWYASPALDGKLQPGGALGVLPGSLSSTHVFYVNTTVLSDAGLSPAKTYDELKAQVPLLKARGYETVILGNEDSWVMQRCLFSLVAGRFCGPGWEQGMLSGEEQCAGPGFTGALEFIRSLYADGVIARSTLLIDYRTVLDRFMENKAAYLIDGDWRIRDFLALPPERQGDFQLALFPDLGGAAAGRSTSLIPGPGWGINAALPERSAEMRAAWRLVRWLSGRETQAWLLSSGAITTPSRIDIDEEALGLKPMEEAAAALVREYGTGTAVIDQVFPGEVCAVINDGLQELGMGTKTSGDVAAAVQAALDAWRVRERQATGGDSPGD